MPLGIYACATNLTFDPDFYVHVQNSKVAEENIFNGGVNLVRLPIAG